VGAACSPAAPSDSDIPEPEPGGYESAGPRRAPAAVMLSESSLVMASDCYSSQTWRGETVGISSSGLRKGRKRSAVGWVVRGREGGKSDHEARGGKKTCIRGHASCW